jgi:hypothetical protein
MLFMAKLAVMEITCIHLWQIVLSLHRVSPVIGSRKRIVALFCYEHNPVMVLGQGYIDELHESMAL